MSRLSGRGAALLAAAVAAGYAVGLGLAAAGAPGAMLWLPLLLAAPAAWLLWTRLAVGDRSGALSWMLAWAAALAVIGPVAMGLAPEAAAAAVYSGVDYRDEMVHWIATGEGAEGDIRRFLPVHLTRLVLFIPLSLASGGVFGLIMGAAMMNFMDLFVASFAAASSGVPAALAWFPWALLRVAGFVVLGVVTAEPLVRRMARPGSRGQSDGRRPDQAEGPSRKRLIAIALALLVADVALKAALAPMWGRFLADSLN